SRQALGGLIVLIAFPLAYLVRERPRDVPASPPANNTASDVSGGASDAPGGPSKLGPYIGSTAVPLGPILGRPEFYLLAIGSMCSIAAVGGTMQNLKLFLSLDVRLAQGEIARLLSLVLVVSLAGRLLMGSLADRFPKKRVMLAIYLAVASGIPLLFFASSRGALYVFAAIFGIGLGGDYMIIPLMAAELFGVAM